MDGMKKIEGEGSVETRDGSPVGEARRDDPNWIPPGYQEYERAISFADLRQLRREHDEPVGHQELKPGDEALRGGPSETARAGLYESQPPAPDPTDDAATLNYEASAPAPSSALYESEAPPPLPLAPALDRSHEKPVVVGLYGHDSMGSDPSPSSELDDDEKFLSLSISSRSGAADSGRSTRLADSNASIKNWTSAFQSLLELEDSYHKFDRLDALASDFAYCAEVYGRIIISEIMLPDREKTIQPVSIGGVAGGQKFYVQGIYFKFSLDLRGIYGGDEYSAKAAGAELRNLCALFNCRDSGIRTPLMALIDFNGYRLVAVSSVPVSAESLVYGSADGGYTVHADPDVHERMRMLASRLNLRNHLAGPSQVEVYGPADIEVHRCGERLYVLDSARLFPPEAPLVPHFSTRPRRGQHLYRFLRPEFIKRYPSALSSDAYSAFQMHDPQDGALKKDVQEATQHLFKVTVPDYAQRMDLMSTSPDKLREMTKAYRLHREGLNVRMLGRLRACLRSRVSRRVVLLEMVARTLKNMLREYLRQEVRRVGTPSMTPYVRLLMRFFNIFLGNSPDLARHSAVFWGKALKRQLLQRFELGLSDSEVKELDLQTELRDRRVELAERLTEMLRIRLSRHSLEQMRLHPDDFVFQPSDVDNLRARVKQLDVIYYSRGRAVMERAIEKHPMAASNGGGGGGLESANSSSALFRRGGGRSSTNASSYAASVAGLARLWGVAGRSFELAMRASSDSQNAVLAWAQMLTMQARQHGWDAPRELLEQANERFDVAMQIDRRNVRAWILWAEMECFWATVSNKKERDRRFARAAERFAAALAIDADALFQHVRTIFFQQRTDLSMFLNAVTLAHDDGGGLLELFRRALREQITNRLDLSDCRDIVTTPDLHIILPDWGVPIESISLQGAHLLDSLEPLVLYQAASLKAIDLRGCTSLPLEHLRSLADACNAEYLAVPFMPGVDEEFLAELRRLMPGCVVELEELASRDVLSSLSSTPAARKLLRLSSSRGGHPSTELAYDPLLRTMAMEELVQTLHSSKDTEMLLTLLMVYYDRAAAECAADHVDVLLSLTRNPRSEVRAWAVLALSRTRFDRISAFIEALLLSESDPGVLEALCLCAARLRVVGASDALLSLYRSHTLRAVRRAAEAALLDMGGADVERSLRQILLLRGTLDSAVESLMAAHAAPPPQDLQLSSKSLSQSSGLVK